MTKFLLAFLFMTAAGSCEAVMEEWHETNERLFKTYVVLNIIDVGQTFNLIDCQRDIDLCPDHNYIETNTLVGTHPNKKSIVAVKALSTYATYYLLDTVASDRERFLALSVINMMMMHTVMNNHSIGLRFSWEF